jgi:hypothetical protein
VAMLFGHTGAMAVAARRDNGFPTAKCWGSESWSGDYESADALNECHIMAMMRCSCPNLSFRIR